MYSLCLLLWLIPFANAVIAFNDEFELSAAVDIFMENDERMGELIGSYGMIEDWDVSSIKNFGAVFSKLRNPKAEFFTADLSKWDVSNAEYLHDMFLGAASFDSDLSNWQVGKVRRFNGLFNGAKSFTGKGLEQWDVSNGRFFMVTFADTQSLRQDLDLRSWKVSRAERMTAMFRGSNFGSNPNTNNLCGWRSHLRSLVETYAMFMRSQCPDKTDPNLDGSALEVSFCTPCPIVEEAAEVGGGESYQPPPSTNGRRPNILFIMTDQQRFDAIRRVQDELPSYDKATKIRTPFLDRLSSSGAYFRNAYCQCSVCAPSRTSLRTGCTVERTGVQHNELTHEYQNSELFTARVQALEGLDQTLTKLGYNSEYYGKWHMPDVLYKHSWDNSTSVIRYNDYDYSTESFYFRYDSNGRKLKRYMQHFENLGDISKELASGAQHDTYTGFPYIPSLIDSRYGYPTGTPLNTENGFLPYETGQPNVCGVSSLSEDFTTSHFTGDVSMKALDRLLAQEDEQPFFLTVSFHNPHPPMIPAQKHVDYYWERRENLFVSPSINDPMDNSDYGKGLPQYQNKTKVQEWTALYYALVEEIDEYVGAMLSRLGDAADDTLIIFTSDHGEMLGAHGKREKNMFYEEAAKVPLFISFPGRIKPNVVVDDVVSHLDVYATIMDYIGAPEVDHSDGSSLRRFIEGSTNAEYDENVVVAEWDYRKPLLSNHQVLDRRIDERPSLMIRKGMYKLMVQKKAESNEIDMMFDLQSDPYEVNNLLGKNAMSASQTTLAKTEHLRCLLIDWMERMDGTEGEGYYSDPLANYGEGGGDIEELSKRQSWRQLDFWIGDAEIKFDRIPWNASSEKFLRSEYLYLGKRTPGSITVSRVRIEGSDAHYFSVDKSHLIISQNQCQRIKVTFAASKNETPPGKIEASIVLEQQGASDTVQISVDDMAFDTTPSLARSTTLVPTSSGPTVAPSKIASSMPTSSEPTVAPSKIPSTQPTKSPASHDSPALFGGFFVGFWEDITDSITEEMLNEMP